MPAAPFRPTPLQIDLARRIAQELACGRFAVGDRLSEEALAAQYQVSRTPVRGALHLLAARGLVVRRPRRGYAVSAHPAAGSSPAIATGTLTLDEVYRLIIDSRARRELPETFTQRDLAQRLDAPRSLLDKALLRLSHDGLIAKRQGHGWQFAPSLESAEALAESYRFRTAIECAGLLEPSFRADPEVLARMRAAHEALVSQKSAQAISAAGFFSLNAAFHEMLARFSGNRFILQAVQQQNQLRRLEEHAAFYREARFLQSGSEHLEIIAAVESGDREWAAQLMRRHLKTSLQAS